MLKSKSWGSCVRRFLTVCALCVQNAEACFDSTGSFYCGSLWYFWFVLFWVCIIIFVTIVCIVNRCTRKRVRVGFLPAAESRLATSQDDRASPTLAPVNPKVREVH